MLTSRPGLRHEADLERGVCRVWLDRPDKLNALTSSMYAGLREVILLAEATPAIEAIVVAGAPGRAFATGGDLAEWESLADASTVDAFVRYDSEWRTPFELMLRCSKTVISVVDGVCVAGGLLMCLSSDVVVATERSSFGLPEARVGIYESFTEVILPHVVGLTRARAMVATGAPIDAVTAERWGIVTRLVAAGEDVEAVVSTILSQVLSTSPEARAAYKRGMVSELRWSDTMGAIRNAFSPSAREGLEAFREQRPPKWPSSNEGHRNGM